MTRPLLFHSERKQRVSAGNRDVLLAIGRRIADRVRKRLATHREAPKQFARRIVKRDHIPVCRCRKHESTCSRKYA